MSAFDEERVKKETHVVESDDNDYDEDEDDYDQEDEMVDTDWVFSSVKRPVDIYLPDEDQWFPGTLMRIVDPIERIALVSYDDEDLADEKVLFEDLRVGVLPSKKRDKEKKAAERRAAAAAAASTNAANANSSYTQVAVNEIKFKRYLYDLIIGEEFVPTWQPPLEKVSMQEIDQLLSLLQSFSTQHAESKLRADLQEFDRSLQQSRTHQDCFVFREDSYLVSLPLHLPPVVRAPGTFIGQKEQEKLASFRQTQFRLGAFILTKDASEVLEVLSEDAYMEKLASMQKIGKEAITSVNLVTLPNGTMPLPAKEPHNQSNKSSVLVARILHAIDTWNTSHSGEDVLDIFCPVKRDDMETSETFSELSSSAVSYEASSSASSPPKITKFSREEVLLGALQGQCHRLSSKIYYNATCSFHALMAYPLVLRDAYRTRLSFSEWQDLLRRQRAHSVGDDSILSVQSDHTNVTTATPTNNNPSTNNSKVRSDSVVSALSEKNTLSKSRSGSIVTEKELNQNNHHNKSRSGSIVTEKEHNPPHGNKSRSGSVVDNDLSTTTGKKNAVRLNSRAARKLAEDDFPENT